MEREGVRHAAGDPPPRVMELLMRDGSPLPEDRLTRDDIEVLQQARVNTEPALWAMWQARAHRLLWQLKPEAAQAAQELLEQADDDAAGDGESTVETDDMSEQVDVNVVRDGELLDEPASAWGDSRLPPRGGSVAEAPKGRALPAAVARVATPQMSVERDDDVESRSTGYDSVESGRQNKTPTVAQPLSRSLLSSTAASRSRDRTIAERMAEKEQSNEPDGVVFRATRRQLRGRGTPTPARRLASEHPAHAKPPTQASIFPSAPQTQSQFDEAVAQSPDREEDEREDERVAARLKGIESRVAVLAEALRAEREHREDVEYELERERARSKQLQKQLSLHKEALAEIESSTASRQRRMYRGLLDVGHKSAMAGVAVSHLKTAVQASFDGLQTYMTSAQSELVFRRRQAAYVAPRPLPARSPTREVAERSSPPDRAPGKASDHDFGAMNGDSPANVQHPVRMSSFLDGLDATTPGSAAASTPQKSPRHGSGAISPVVSAAVQSPWAAEHSKVLAPERDVVPPAMRVMCRIVVSGGDTSRIGYTSQLDPFSLGSTGSGRDGGTLVVHAPSPTNVELRRAGETAAARSFRFDRVVRAPTVDSMKEIGRLVSSQAADAVSRNTNACVMVHGGPDAHRLETAFGGGEAPGAMSQAVSRVFEQCVMNRRDNVFSIAVTVNAVALRSDGLQDLLAPKRPKSRPQPRWQTRSGSDEGYVQLANAVAVRITSAQDFARVMDVVRTRLARTTGAEGGSTLPTTVVCVELETHHFKGKGSRTSRVSSSRMKSSSGAAYHSKFSKVAFVCLADDWEDVGGDLSALRTVIDAVCAKAAAGDDASVYVPYDASRLTSLLRDVVTGTSSVDFVGVVAPHEDDEAGSAATLAYAERLHKSVKSVAAPRARPVAGLSWPPQ